MNPVILSLGAGSVVMLCSLVGVLTTHAFFRSHVERNIRLLASFSAGVFLIVALLLLQELFIGPDGSFADQGAIALFSVFGGVLLMILLSRIPEFHHHHDEEDDHIHTHKSARKIIVSDAVHNVGDGIIIAAAFTASTPLGFTATAAILIHEIIQELSEFFILRQSGYSTKKTLIVNFAVSSAILAGIALGLTLGHIERVESILLGLATGTLTVVVFHDLIPQSIHSFTQEKRFLAHILAFCAGSGIMFAVHFFFPE